MARLVILVAFIGAFAAVLNFRGYGNLEVQKARFDYDKAKVAHQKHVEEVAELERKRMEILNPPKVEETEVVEGPLVVLDTPELERGSALYSKCIVCHGKAGQGKKSQNAPGIGGQYDWYVAKQIKAMQTGERVNQVMMPYIKKLTEQDISDLAAYISKLPWMKQ